MKTLKIAEYLHKYNLREQFPNASQIAGIYTPPVEVNTVLPTKVRIGDYVFQVDKKQTLQFARNVYRKEIVMDFRNKPADHGDALTIVKLCKDDDKNERKLTFDNFKKTAWYIAHNMPAKIVLYAEYINNALLGYIKFCVSNNIAVDVYCYDNVYELYPVCNFKDWEVNILFAKFLIEEKDKRASLEERHLEVFDIMLNLLQEQRAEVKALFWTDIEDSLEELKTAMDEAFNEYTKKAEHDADSYSFIEVARARELKYKGRVLMPQDLDNPEVFERLVTFVQTYARAFDISVKFDTTETNVGTYTPFKWTKLSATKTADELSDKSKRKWINKIHKKLNPDSKTQWIEAYAQCKFYYALLKQNPNEAITFVHPDWYICPECHKPEQNESLLCRHCGARNEFAYGELHRVAALYDEFGYKYDIVTLAESILKTPDERQVDSYKTYQMFYGANDNQ